MKLKKKKYKNYYYEDKSGYTSERVFGLFVRIKTLLRQKAKIDAKKFWKIPYKKWNIRMLEFNDKLFELEKARLETLKQEGILVDEKIKQLFINLSKRQFFSFFSKKHENYSEYKHDFFFFFSDFFIRFKERWKKKK
jgi:hypothetical protein